METRILVELEGRGGGALRKASSGQTGGEKSQPMIVRKKVDVKHYYYIVLDSNDSGSTFERRFKSKTKKRKK